MHVVLLNDDALPDSRGGVAVLVDQLRRGLTAAGIRVTLLTTHRGNTAERVDTHDAAGNTISVRAEHSLRDQHRRSVRMTDTTKKICTLISELKPNIVHAHNVHAYIGYPALVHAHAIGAKTFLTAHDTFLVSFNRVNTERYRKAILAGRPYRMHWWEHLLAVGRKYWPLRNSNIRELLHKGDVRVLTYSNAMKTFLMENGIRNIAAIPALAPTITPPDEARIVAFKQQHKLDGPCILFGGRVSADKGINALLHAFTIVLREMPSAILLLVGDEARIAPQLTSIDAKTRDRIRITGWIAHKDIAVAYAAADMVTTPSIYLDNFPTINLEAMMISKPVVGTCFGGTPEAVLHNVTGIVINPLDAPAYAMALQKILNDPALAAKLGAAGYNHVQQHYSRKAHIQAYMDLYAATPKADTMAR